MASVGNAEILHPTPERINFYRLTTLLIVGGTEIMRQTFDSIHPPRTLATALAKVKSTIERAGRLTRVQMDLLYPPAGSGPVHSRDFDITLLFALLRNMCGLAPPTTGWDILPDDRDKSLVADLVRIKYYRNELYAHTSGRMEVSDDEFNRLWGDIGLALVRIIGTSDPHKRMKWKGDIDNLKSAPLEPPRSLDILIGQLKEWHETEMKELRRLDRSVSDLTQSTEAMNISVQENSKKVETLQDTVLQMATKENSGSDVGPVVSGRQIGTAQNWNVTNLSITNVYTSPPVRSVHELPRLPPVVSPSSSGGESSRSPQPADGSGSPFSQHFSVFEANTRPGGVQQSRSNPQLSQDWDHGKSSPFTPMTYNADDYDGLSMRCSTPIGSGRPRLPPQPNKPQDLASGPGEYCAARGGARPKTRPYDPPISPSTPQFHGTRNADSSFSTSSIALASQRSGHGNSPSHLPSGADFTSSPFMSSYGQLTGSTSSSSFFSPEWSAGENIPSAAYPGSSHNRLPRFSSEASVTQDRVFREPTRENPEGVLEIVIRCWVPCGSGGPSDVMDKIAQAHIKPCSPSERVSKGQFQSYLEDGKNLKVISYQVVREKCTILVQPLLLDALEELWTDYKEGNLAAITQSTLATPEVLQGITEDVQLQVQMNENQYMRCISAMRSKDPTTRTRSFTENRPVNNPPRRPKSMPTLNQKEPTLFPVGFCKAVRTKAGCPRPSCPDLHLCPFYLLGKCERNHTDCCRSHYPDDQHTRRVLMQLGLGNLSQEERLSFLQKLALDKKSEWKTPHNAVPKICRFYKMGKCTAGPQCAFLHVCAYWVKDNCKYGSRCNNDHNFKSDHNQHILKRDDLQDLHEREISQLLRQIGQDGDCH